VSAETSRLAITGAKWVAIGTVSQKALRMLLVVVLARLLTPDDFGLIAVASLVLALAGRVKQLGFHGALIQRQEDLEEASNAYFFLNIGLVTLTFVVILAMSPLAVWFFNDDRVALVINVMAIRLLAEAAGAVQRSLTVRDLAFRRQTFIQLAETCVTAGVAVSLALMGFGVWAMVWGMVLGAAFAALLWWASTPWHPTRAWSWPVARQMLRFGVDLWSVSNLSYLLESAGRFFVGRFLGVVPLGYFEFSNRVIHGPTGSLVETSNRVALPAFCREQEDLDRIGQWYVKMTGYVCLVTAPIAVTLLFLSDQLIPVVFGPQWLTTIPLLRALAPFVYMSPLVFAWPVYVATSNARLLMRFTAVRFVIAVPLLLMAAQVSLLAVCLVESFAVCLLAPVNLYLVTRIISVRVSVLLRTMGQPLVAAGVLGLTVIALRSLFGNLFPEPTPLSLTVYLLPGLLIYLVAIVLMQPRLFADLRRVVAVALGLHTETDRQ
jgi:PST family polysaccharide transporter